MDLVKIIGFSWTLLVQQSCPSIGTAIKLEPHPNHPVAIGKWNRTQTSLAREEPAYEGRPSLVSERHGIPLLEECTPPNGSSLQRIGFRRYSNIYITYNIATTSRTISDADIRRAMKSATAAWSSVTPIIFADLAEEAHVILAGESDEADIAVSFDQLDGCENTEPNLQRVLACADYNNQSPRGSVRFNDSVDWFYSGLNELNRSRAMNMICIAMHEIGHALGLMHSCTDGVMMFPLAVKYHERCDLADEDKLRIQAVYGTPWANNRYFYNAEKALFMIAPKCADSDCPMQLGQSEDAEPWELFSVPSQWTVQIRSTADRNLCVEASDDGMTSLVKCAMDAEGQLWDRDGDIDMEATTFINVASRQFLYADCDDNTVCTKASDDPEFDETYARWTISRDLEKFEKFKIEQAKLKLR